MHSGAGGRGLPGETTARAEGLLAVAPRPTAV